MKTNTKISIVQKGDIKEIDYNSPNFKKGLKKVQAQNELTLSAKKIDLNKKDFCFNI
jgi:hypothetical protein